MNAANGIVSQPSPYSVTATSNPRCEMSICTETYAAEAEMMKQSTDLK
jgi:hypothetical protein